MITTLLAEGGTICYHGCKVGDGIVALAIALGVVGIIWALFH